MEILLSDSGFRQNVFRGIFPIGRVCSCAFPLILFLATTWAADNSGSVPATLIQSLPSGATPRSLTVDGNGNLLVTGEVAPPGKDFEAIDAFVAKLSTDGALIYLKTFGGASFDIATGIAVDSAGSAYVTGYTNSHDFPTTKNAWQTVFRSSGRAAFAAKLSASGDLIYSTLLGGTTDASGWGIAVNASGEAFVTGDASSDFPVTPGVIKAPPAPRSFIVRLSKTGDQAIFAAIGAGGHLIALDDQDNVYTAGSALDQGDIPITANAFQTHTAGGNCAGGAQLMVPCTHQYVCKLDSTASTLFFCTYVTGSSGEKPAGIAVDKTGNVLLTGATLSADYPVTPDAFQSVNHSSLPPDPLNQPAYPSMYWAFPTTGYFTKLIADGTRLLYSTYLGGSLPDLPSAISVDDKGQVFIAANVQSADFPGLPSVPSDCLPKRLRGMPVVVRLTPTGFSVDSTTVVEGAPYCEDCGPLLAIRPQGTLDVVRRGPFRARITDGTSSSQDPIGCITDSADFAQIGPVAPGQLISIFGNAIGPSTPVSYDPSLPALPIALGGVSVEIDGEPASLLYVSSSQINLAVPSGVLNRSTATIKLTTPTGISGQRTVSVLPVSPALFTNGITGYPLCQSKTLLNSVSALVFNQDGTVNSCENPAPPGSAFWVFLNGVGQQPPTATADNLTVEAVEPIAGPAGLNVLRVTGRLPSGTSAYATLSLRINGVNAREQNVAIWVRP
jgi:uncharacterized protein (TIGR03437 family)